MKGILTSLVKSNLENKSQHSGVYYEIEDPEEEQKKKRSDLQIEKPEKDKQGYRFTQMYNIVDTFRHHVKLANKRKVLYFKTRKIDAAKFKYKKVTTKVKKNEETDELYSAELEMATISSLREMYFNKPKGLVAVEEIKIEKEPRGGKLPDIKPCAAKLLPTTSVFKPYLGRYNQTKLDELFLKIPRKGNLESMGPRNRRKYAQIKRSRDAIRNAYIVSVFNIDDDNFFNDHELFQIDQMKRDMCVFKESSDQNNDVHFMEVWDWDEFENNFPYFTANKDPSRISDSNSLAEEPDDKPIPKPHPNKRMKHYLINWFRRESPIEKSEDTLHKFRFYENRYSKKYTFLSDKSRLNAAIKFLKFAKIVYPDLEYMKVLTELKSYIGPVNLDEFQAQTRAMGSVLIRPKHKLRYFRKLLKETKKLENMFGVPEIKTNVEDDLKEESNKINIHKRKEESLKSAFNSIHLSKLYYKYVESRLPPPFNELFVSIADGLLKYNLYVSCDPDSKEYKKEFTKLVARVLYLMLNSMKWVVDTTFRSNALFDVSALSKKDTSTDDEEDSAPGISREGPDLRIKKLMVFIIKFMNFKHLFHKKDPDIISMECTSLSCTSLEGEKEEVG